MTMPNQSKCRTAVFLLMKPIFKAPRFDWSRWDQEWISYAKVTVPASDQFQLYGKKVDYTVRLETLIHEVIPGEEPTGAVHLWFEVGESADHEARPLWERKLVTFKVSDLLKNPLTLAKQVELEVSSQLNSYGGWLDHSLWELTK